MLWTLSVTILRALRTPNDFAEAHWLLDYRFGFVKRALLGEILSRVTGYLSVPITARLILNLSALAFIVFCGTIIFLWIRILQKSEWSNGAVVLSLVFLSSPFFVMSAHLMGYYDNIVVTLAIASIALLMSGRIWTASCVMALTMLVHENALLIGFPPLCLAWLLTNRKRRTAQNPALPFLPLLLPILTFIAVAASQSSLTARGFAGLYSARLAQYPFIQHGRSTLVPAWISTSFYDYLRTQGSSFPFRLLSPYMFALVLPSALAILSFAVRTFRLIAYSAEWAGLLAVAFVPQIMHVLASDTPRIWTYTILCAFLALWIYAEHFPMIFSAPENWRLLCLALAVNIVILTPLMDDEIDHFSLAKRLLLYSPTIVASLFLLIRPRSSTPDQAALSIT